MVLSCTFLLPRESRAGDSPGTSVVKDCLRQYFRDEKGCMLEALILKAWFNLLDSGLSSKY